MNSKFYSDRVTEETSRRIEVNGKEKFFISGCGQYNLAEKDCSEMEADIAKVHMLEHFVQLTAAAICNNGDAGNVVGGDEILKLARIMYERYAYFYRNGLNVFEYCEYYDKFTLEKYLNRTVVAGHFNCPIDERQHDDLPEGWWYDFPGHAVKYFDITDRGTKIVVDCDTFIRIGFYYADDKDNDNPYNWIDIEVRGDYSAVFKYYPELATELMQACEFVYAQYHI
jgi:hypothetical protein